MTTLISKLAALARSLADEGGDLSLFGVFQQVEGSGNWDIVVSATWIKAGPLETTRFFANKVISVLTEEEILMIRGVFVLAAWQPFVQQAVSMFPVGPEDGVLQLSNVEIAGLRMNTAYIITAAENAEETGVGFVDLDTANGQGEYDLKSTGERGEQDIPVAIRYLPLRVSAATTDASDSKVIPSMP